MQRCLKSNLLGDSVHYTAKFCPGVFLALDSQGVTPQPNLVLPWFLVPSIESVRAVSPPSHHR